jgi:hypothetical protein
MVLAKRDQRVVKDLPVSNQKGLLGQKKYLAKKEKE